MTQSCYIIVVSVIFSALTFNAVIANYLNEILGWRKEEKVSINGNKLLRRRGYLRAPSDYSSGKSKMKIYVESYRMESLWKHKHHLILIAGGPGEDSTVWHEDIPRFLYLMGSDSVVYLIDHRGIGKSQPLFEPNDKSWRWSIPYNSKVVKNYSVTNAARDVALLGKMIFKLYDGKEIGTVNLLGVSYGGLLSARVVSLYPKLFDWLILDSPSMISHRFSPENDAFFWESCKDNQFCKNKIKSVERIKQIYDSLVRGKKRNKCTESVFKTTLQTIENLLRPFIKNQIQFNDGFASMLIVPFILQVYQCRNPRFLREKILKKIVALISHGNAAANGGESKSSQPNSFMNSYICTSEIFDYSQVPHKCHSEGRLKIINDQCPNFHRYLEDREALEDHIYETDEYRLNPIESSKTKVVAILGGMDLITSPTATIRWLSKITAKEIGILFYKNLEHAITPNIDCLDRLFELITGNDSLTLKDVRDCVKRVNRHSLDWEFSGDMEFAREWWKGVV